MDITLICVGRLKERFYIDAAAEYQKRLTPFCRLAIVELPEARRSGIDRESALRRESEYILAAIPKGATVFALCIEGTALDSRAFAAKIGDVGKLCFIIGGSDGLHEDVKKTASFRLSMSPMTFPHHLARVMLMEQIYRAFTIINGGKYHK